MSTCPTCDQDITLTPDGRQLSAHRSIVGRYLPDDTELTPDEQRDPRIRAHHLHHCPPRSTPPATPTPEQHPLF